MQEAQCAAIFIRLMFTDILTLFTAGQDGRTVPL